MSSEGKVMDGDGRRYRGKTTKNSPTAPAMSLPQSKTRNTTRVHANFESYTRRQDSRGVPHVGRNPRGAAWFVSDAMNSKGDVVQEVKRQCEGDPELYEAIVAGLASKQLDWEMLAAMKDLSISFLKNLEARITARNEPKQCKWTIPSSPHPHFSLSPLPHSGYCSPGSSSALFSVG